MGDVVRTFSQFLGVCMFFESRSMRGLRLRGLAVVVVVDLEEGPRGRE